MSSKTFFGPTTVLILFALLPMLARGDTPTAPPPVYDKLDKILQKLERIERRLDAVEKKLSALVGSSPFDEDGIPTRELRVLTEKPNKELVVEWQGSWWPASLKETNQDQHLIGYQGWGPEWDEWVGKDRMRYLTQPGSVKVGQDVAVQQGAAWYPAIIVKIKDDRAKLSPRTPNE
jgi:hypothetical protein